MIGTVIEMRNVLDGHQGKPFTVRFISEPFQPNPECIEDEDIDKLAFVRLKNPIPGVLGEVQLAVHDKVENSWGFDPTFWDCVSPGSRDYFQQFIPELDIDTILY